MDSFNRMASFEAGRMAVRKWAPKLRDGSISQDKFLLKTGLAGDAVLIQKDILRDVNLGRFDDAARKYGKHVSDESQYIYARGSAPLAFQKVHGKLFGQFGIWPMGYAEYIGRNLTTKNLTSPSVRNRYAAAFALRAAGMGAAFTTATYVAGVDFSSYNFANPLDYEGGPYFQAAGDVISAVRGSEYEKGQSRAALMRAASNMIIPFRSAGYDLMEASEARDPIDAILLAMGFNLAGERRARQRKK